ncbi:UNVERIFIED_CONTAM: hypothetical protein RMT77_012091 [Armadillidium vulgare]
MKVILLTLYLTGFVATQQTRDRQQLMNWCIDSKHHKTEPGPEGALFGQCTPWKERACCTSNTTKNIHENKEALYNFDFNHCSEMKPLSAECLKHFNQDHCFYECSPNIGPWVVKEERSWRKERYFKVPLCASDCDVWYEACKNDFTCTDNWSQNFDWKTVECEQGGGTCKRNVCPADSECQTFQRIFGNAKNFCERVWDHAWEYTSSETYCMRLWFSGTAGNPNDRVAEWKASQLSGASNLLKSCAIFIASIVILFSF